MPEDIIEKKSNFDLTSRSAFSREEEVFTSRSYAALLAKNIIPYSHRKIADNYVIVKRIFKFQAVMSRISNAEKSMLAKYDLTPLNSLPLNRCMRNSLCFKNGLFQVMKN